jgi:hypothetical protein
MCRGDEFILQRTDKNHVNLVKLLGRIILSKPFVGQEKEGIEVVVSARLDRALFTESTERGRDGSFEISCRGDMEVYPKELGIKNRIQTQRQQLAARDTRMRTKLPLAFFVCAKGIHNECKHASSKNTVVCSDVAECERVWLDPVVCSGPRPAGCRHKFLIDTCTAERSSPAATKRPPPAPYAEHSRSTNFRAKTD